MADAVKVLRGLEELYPEVRLIERLRHCIEHHPDQNWEDAMSRGQIRSKQWLVHELISHGRTFLGDVIVCGGWIGTLSRFFLDCPDLTITRVTSLDQDIMACMAAKELNDEYLRTGRFRSWGEDCYYHDYTNYDTVINTSMEHFEHLDFWWNRIPSGKLVILQNNDFLEPEDHINTVSDEEELRDYFEMSQIIYSGTLPTHKYNRYMVIGVK